MRLYKDIKRLTALKRSLASDHSESEIQQLFYSIVNNSSNSVVLTNANKDIIYVNQSFEVLSGYTLDEVLGKNPKIIKSNKTPSSVYRDMHQRLRNGLNWKGVFINRHKSGNEYVEEVMIKPIRNDKDEITYYLAEKKDITSFRNSESMIKKLTNFDSLTGLPNRDNFIDYTNALTKRTPNNENSFAVIFADLNRFKELNDHFGHQVGDAALIEVARRIESTLEPRDFAARLGGDEFVIVHTQATQKSTTKLAQRLSLLFSSAFKVEQYDVFLGISLGSAVWPRDGNTLSEVLSHADLAMYEAKSTGIDYFRYTNCVGSRFYREVTISQKLVKAIHKQQLYLMYQPKYDLACSKMDGLEVLLRWTDDELGDIYPAEFIYIAEKYGMINMIGNWVIQQVCRQLNQWESLGVKVRGRLAINVSVQQIEHPNFFENISDILEQEKVLPTMLELEVTESVLMRDPEKAMSVIKRLSNVGFRISIDDFGTGFSSLSYLRQMDVDVLKIDKVFIEHITTSLQNRMIVKSVIELSHNFGLLAIAEGVETKEQVECLINMGCKAIQGFYYSKPLTAVDTYRFILEQSE